ncbi:MAG: hypothetical protein RR212_14595 [Bacteroidales bacterium]
MRNFKIEMYLGCVLGILFIVSGFVKVVDPIGFSYKIEEYLGLFQLSSWKGLSVSFSILLSAAGITWGSLLLLWLWRRSTGTAVSVMLYFWIYDGARGTPERIGRGRGIGI